MKKLVLLLLLSCLSIFLILFYLKHYLLRVAFLVRTVYLPRAPLTQRKIPVVTKDTYNVNKVNETLNIRWQSVPHFCTGKKRDDLCNSSRGYGILLQNIDHT